MKPEIKRATELFLCGKLKEALPGLTIVPYSGGDSGNDAFEVEPPLVVVSINEAEKMYNQESTFLGKGTCQVITHNLETNSNDHSKLARRVYVALDSIAADSSNPDFAFHGITVDDQKMTEDPGGQLSADLISFKVGMGG